MNHISSVTQSAEYWTRFSTTANNIYIALAILVAVATFFVTWSSRQSQFYSSLLQAATDNEIKGVQADAEVKQALAQKMQVEAAKKIAELNAQAAALATDAAKAKEGMARANAQIAHAQNGVAEANKQAQIAINSASEAREKQEEIRQENIKLSTRLNQSIADSRSKQTKLAEAQRKEAEARLALQQALEGVRIRQLPRTLTAEQSQQLLEVLQTGPKGTVYLSFPNGNEEAHSLAIELSNLLTKSGWTAIGCTAVLSPVVRWGLWIQVFNARSAPDYAGFLQKSLGRIGLPAQGEELSGIPKGQVILFVGNKPN